MIEKGDQFVAFVRVGPHSLTLAGEEGAGRRIGPFTATKVTKTNVQTEDYQFYFSDFAIVKVDGTDG